MTDCTSLTTTLPSLPDNTVCHITESCNSVQCCINVDKIGQSFEASIDIDPCKLILKIRIEKLKFEKSLLDFQWGTPVEMWLFGLVKIR